MGGVCVGSLEGLVLPTSDGCLRALGVARSFFAAAAPDDEADRLGAAGITVTLDRSLLELAMELRRSFRSSLVMI